MDLAGQAVFPAVTRYNGRVMDELNQLRINDQLSIPLAELEFRFSTSGGPGGQHANRSATRVTLLFDVAGSPSLAPKQRDRLLRKLAGRLDKRGVLQVEAQTSRSQRKNRELAVSRFQKLLAKALKKRKKRRKTKPTAASQEKRLKQKKARGKRKRERGRKWPDE
jgi:ribosome-associated protein